MIRSTRVWGFSSALGKPGSNPAVEAKRNLTCGISDPSRVENGEIRLHLRSCWNTGNPTNPRATLIKAELCWAGFINQGPETPQFKIKPSQPLTAAKRHSSPIWSPAWTLLAPAQMPMMDFDLIALSAMGFQTKPKLNYLHEQWQKKETREKQGSSPNSITCQGNNAVLRSSQGLTSCSLSLGSQQRQLLSPAGVFLSLHISCLLRRSCASIASA